MEWFQESAVIEKPVEEVFARRKSPERPVVELGGRGGEANLGGLARPRHNVRPGAPTPESAARIAFEVTRFEPNTLLEIGRFSGCLRAAVGRRRFEAVPAGTRVTFSGEGTSGRFFNLLDPRVAAAAKRQARTGLASLKDVLESQQQQHGEHL